MPNCLSAQGDAAMPDPRFARGPVAVFECLQQIPCNPCADACPQKAITVKDINSCPELNETLCNGCGVCMTHCPGLSVFVVDYTFSPDRTLVKIPYEFYPLPQVNEQVDALNRKGECIGAAQVVRVQLSPNKTHIIWLALLPELTMQVRGIRLRKGKNHE